MYRSPPATVKTNQETQSPVVNSWGRAPPHSGPALRCHDPGRTCCSQSSLGRCRSSLRPMLESKAGVAWISGSSTAPLSGPRMAPGASAEVWLTPAGGGGSGPTHRPTPAPGQTIKKEGKENLWPGDLQVHLGGAGGCHTLGLRGIPCHILFGGRNPPKVIKKISALDPKGRPKAFFGGGYLKYKKLTPLKLENNTKNNNFLTFVAIIKIGIFCSLQKNRAFGQILGPSHGKAFFSVEFFNKDFRGEVCGGMNTNGRVIRTFICC